MKSATGGYFKNAFHIHKCDLLREAEVEEIINDELGIVVLANLNAAFYC